MRSSTVWGFWGTVLWGIVITILLIVGQLIPIVIYFYLDSQDRTLDAFFIFLQTIDTDAFLLALSVICSAIIVVPLVLGIAKLKRGSTIRDYFAFYLISWRTFFWWFLVLLVLLVFESYLIELFGADEIPSFMMNIEFQTVGSIWLLIFAVSIAAPLLEEIVFRGFLLKGFSDTFMGTYGAIVVTSLLWATIHLQYEFAYVFVIFIVGLVFGYARVKTNSILTPMMMHFFMNIVASLGLFMEKGNFA